MLIIPFLRWLNFSSTLCYLKIGSSQFCNYEFPKFVYCTESQTPVAACYPADLYFNLIPSPTSNRIFLFSTPFSYFVISACFYFTYLE